MLSRAVLAAFLMFALGGCSSSPSTDNASGSQSDAATSSTAPAAPTKPEGQPKTLEAATAAEQENADRYSSGDFAGQWLLYSKQLRDAISQEDYVRFAERCVEELGIGDGMTLQVEGVRMEGDSKAIVRVGVLGLVKKSRTMVYEDGQWLQEPTNELTDYFGLPVDEWKC
ncbi:hypothetical protein [Mycolicibacterium lacusdiani]|uniref:hypothetical protein n=1 Tax=Mycolicibacterium lacusdiani TaxID=2895283 RepID=UPI001F425EB8|nr:hypothetical protein [Mycolicibacterium lacusdiani]